MAVLELLKKKLSIEHKYFHVVLTLFVGLFLSFIAYSIAYQIEKKHLANRFRLDAHDYACAVQKNIETNLVVVKNLTLLFEASIQITRQEFKLFTTPFINKYQAIQALEWIPRVTNEKRTIYVQAARKVYPNFQITEQIKQGQMVAVGQKDEYFPVYYVEPYEGNEIALGYDLSSSPIRLAALNKSRDTGLMIATGRIVLVQEKDSQPGLLLFSPVYRKNMPLNSIQDRQNNLLGFVLGIYKIETLINTSLENFSEKEFDITIFDLSSDKNQSLLYSSLASFNNQAKKLTADSVKENMFVYNHHFNIADRTWLLHLVPAKGYYSTQATWWPQFILSVGLFVTLLVCGYIWKILCHTEELDRFAKKYDLLAHIDILTNLPNRLNFEETLKRSISYAERHNSSMALLILDLDNFKRINDTLGHHIGDALLKEVAKRLKSAIREYDFVSRLGGDEFAIIISDIKNYEDIGSIARKLLQAFVEVYTIKGNKIFTSASIGIAIYPFDSNNPDDLFKYADIAMYGVKQSGRSNYKYFSSELDKKHHQELNLRNTLFSAIEQQKFFLLYQPIFEISTKKMTGIAPLLRWNHPELGLLTPDIFFPIAEKTGYMCTVDSWVLKTACKQFVDWGLFLVKDFFLSINLSGCMLLQKGLIQSLSELLDETSMLPEKLTIDFLEKTISANLKIAAETFKKIQKTKICISVNDYGSGPASLDFLRALPISVIKIDRYLIQDTTRNLEYSKFIKSTVAFAKELNLRVIAEGVETEEQLNFLVENGCQYAQGYYFSKLLTAEQMTNLLKEKKIID